MAASKGSAPGAPAGPDLGRLAGPTRGACRARYGTTTARPSISPASMAR